MKSVYIFGHRNPDNDSVCSAVGYAHLKNQTDPESSYVPARLGPVPHETEWAFKRFGATLPEEIQHIHTRVRDVMHEDVVTIRANEPMLVAGKIMRENNLKALPVLEEGGRVLGLLSQRRLAMRYLEETEINGFKDMPVELGLLARAVQGEILVGDPEMPISGDVLIAAGEPGSVIAAIKPGDIVILGDRKRTQPMAIEAGVSVLVVTMGNKPSADVLALARERNCAIVLTKEASFATARRISFAQPVGDLMETDLTFVSPETLVAEAAEDLFASPHRELVVIDGAGKCVGILTRTDVARNNRRQCILVDHNEMSQSALGIEDAAVIEIIDHHRVGDIQSSGPILFLNMPVGSTATIVAMRYEELQVEMPVHIAGILLSALLTDTVLLKSPTTTARDHEVAARLGKIVGVDPLEYGMELFRSRSEGRAFSVDAALKTDLKEYRAGDIVAAIAQYEAVDLTDLMAHRDELIAAMNSMLRSREYDVVILMATDIIKEGSEIFAVGKTRLVERALDIDLADGSAWMDGVLSRKKQVAARFMDAS